MLKELFDAICQQTRSALRPCIIPTPDEPQYRYLLAKVDGTCEMRTAAPPPRQHKASDLSAIAEWAKCKSDTPAVIWFSRQGVTLFLDDDSRRDVVSLSLSFHPQFLALGGLEKNKPFLDQKAFIRLLDYQLSGCDTSKPPILLDIIRKVRFKKHESGESVVLHNKASIGRLLEAELNGTAPVPERIVLTVPVFAPPLHDTTHPVCCAVEVDAASEKFQLIPLPGELEIAACSAEASLSVMLREVLGDSIPLYYGNP